MITIVGNKNDLLQRQVSVQEGEEFAKKNNYLFFETSAKNGTNIENIFFKTAELITLKLLNSLVIPSGTSGIKAINSTPGGHNYNHIYDSALQTNPSTPCILPHQSSNHSWTCLNCSLL